MSQARDFADSFSAVSTGRRRININGAMEVAQRGTSFTGKTGSTYGIDRYETKIGTAGTWTLSQSSTAPEGFSKSYKVNCTVANSSLSAASNMLIQQRIEGQDLVQLKKGTSNAVDVTMSFWVRSSKTGTYVLEILDNDNSRHIATTYSISSSDTWEYKTITFDGDTSGALTYDNTASLEFNFWLVAGSNYNSGTLPTSWASTTTANRAVGQLNLADSTSNDFYITGIQLELGNSASPFEHRNYGEELALCQRYFFAETMTAAYHQACSGYYATSTEFIGVLDLPVPMRVGPSITTTGNYQCAGNGAADASNLTVSSNSGDNLKSVQIRADTSGRTAGEGAMLRNKNDTTATFHLSSEL